MKKLFLLLLSLVLIFGCDKPERVDPRYKFIGTYKGFYEQSTGGNPDWNCKITYSKVEQERTIELGKTDSTLYYNDTYGGFELKPRKDGSYYYWNTQSGTNTELIVRNDSFYHFESNYKYPCTYSDKFKGKKIK